MITVDIVRGKEQLAPFHSMWCDKVKFAGGFVRWMCSPAVTPALPGDLDVYPNNMEIFDEVTQQLNQMGYVPHISAVAASYNFNGGVLEGAPKVQIIKPINAGAIIAQGTVSDIINSFDFTVVRIGIPINGNLSFAWADDEFLKHEMYKQLCIKNIHCPISTIKRIAKYVTKGYNIKPFELLKLYRDWDKRTVEYKDELQDVLDQMAAASNWWELDEETRERVQTLLYQD